MTSDDKTSNRDERPTAKTSSSSFYKTIWRWHFYAGLIFTPFLLILAITGGIYLFKPQIENFLYQDLYEVENEEGSVLPSKQIEAVTSKYIDAHVYKYRPSDSPTRSSEVGVHRGDGTYTIFVNPHNGEIIGQLNDKDRLMDNIEKFHGELMVGTIGDRIVELAACWGLVLVVTGIYLWWPRRKTKFWGVVLPRFSKGKKVLTRDLHAVPAFWISAGLLFLIFTGLPWSGLWGNTFQQITTNAGLGYPPSVWVGDAPKSDVQTKEIADVPWAAETMKVPLSTSKDLLPLSIDDVVKVADEQNVTKGYNVIFPQTGDGVYTLSLFPPKAQDEVTMHIDQYTGAVLADYRYDSYKPLGKMIAFGITIHKGTQFGLMNQLIGLLVCLGIAGVVLSGFYLWLKRKPKSKLGAPKAAENPKQMKILSFIIIIMGILFPLVGISIIVVLLFDFFVVKRVPQLKRFLNA
ncbi:PepSY-associated TM helix domain-containing protein [Priestia endophytica]|uniref:PepSY-associated TM helix domain-containing protein n=1 Tax=Priestia endophytica TaxID=135735 RepID=UPI0022826387|nr:PepSY domain-containing protein [Priestia endophytica]MCY8230909.1 PepSY domain-containing protein [Priestia endophytica]